MLADHEIRRKSAAFRYVYAVLLSGLAGSQGVATGAVIIPT